MKDDDNRKERDALIQFNWRDVVKSVNYMIEMGEDPREWVVRIIQTNDPIWKDLYKTLVESLPGVKDTFEESDFHETRFSTSVVGYEFIDTLLRALKSPLQERIEQTRTKTRVRIVVFAFEGISTARVDYKLIGLDETPFTIHSDFLKKISKGKA